MNLERDVVTAYEFNNLEEMERKFEELKTKVRFKAEEDKKSRRKTEADSVQSEAKISLGKSAKEEIPGSRAGSLT